MNYYAPEVVRYIQGTTGPVKSLTEAADIFALGLIYAEYLTGRVPAFDPAHHEPAIAVLHGETLRLSPSRAHSSVVELVERMLLLDPAARPTVGEVHSTLMSVRGGSATTTARAPVPIRPLVAPHRAPATPAAGAPMGGRSVAPASRGPSALRGKGLRLAGAEPPAAAEPPTAAGRPPAGASAPTRGRALLGKLIGKF